jgi:hypothetical protein
MKNLFLAGIALILCTITGCGGNAGTQTTPAAGPHAADTPVADTTAPTFKSFTMPASATALKVAVTSFEANDNVACTGYMITETNTPPLADDAGWSPTEQATFTFSTAGVKTAYAWAKDAAGNVSPPATANVSITLANPTQPDTSPPIITSFALTATATTATINVATVTFTATDDVGVTGFMIKEVNSAPLAGDAGWKATPPATFSFPSASPKPLYGWAKDVAGNVSQVAQANITIAP